MRRAISQTTKNKSKHEKKLLQHRQDRRRGVEFHSRREGGVAAASSAVLETEKSNQGERYLETHRWMAKRMHMVRQWGYVLPMRLCGIDSLKVVELMSEGKSIVHDSSYYSCIQVCGKGSQKDVLELFMCLSDPHHSIHSDDDWLSGRRKVRSGHHSHQL